MEPVKDDNAEGVVCSVCGLPSTSQCSRCQYTNYCGKECQRGNWPMHKPVCGRICIERENFKCGKWLEFANKRILGNILIMSSHRAGLGLGEPIGTVFVNIDETRKGFMDPGSMHFAHLSYSTAPAEFAKSKYNIDLSLTSNLINTINTVYILKDFTHIVNNSLPENLETLKNNHPYTDDDWSILFEL